MSKIFYIVLLLFVLSLFSNPGFASCVSDSDCPDGWSCTGAQVIVANCPEGKDCYGCEEVLQPSGGDCVTDCLGACTDAGYSGLYEEECRQSNEQCEIQCGVREKPKCPVYKTYDDCVSRCNTDDDMCAAYLGSCDSICYSLKEDESYDSSDSGNSDASNNNEITDDCLSGCSVIYDGCIATCDGGSKSVDCQIDCTRKTSSCAKSCIGGDGIKAKESCDIDCSVNICKDKTLLYDGFCEDGECKYYSFGCSLGCADDGASCYKVKTNTVAPKIELKLSKLSIVLNGRDSVKISVALKYQNGTPVKNADVYIRVNDPKSIGILGKWGFRDVAKQTDSSGLVSGALKFSDIKTISRVYWDDLPYSLDVEVKAFKHDDYDDWKVEADEKIDLYSPVPKITSIAITPNPAQTYLQHNVKVDIQDFDSQKGFTYKLTNYGGSWAGHEKSIDGCTGRVCTIKSDLLFESWSWVSPARGLNADEIVLAREMEGNMGGLAINLMFSAGGDYAKAQAKKLPGKLIKNIAYGYHIAKSGYNLVQNAKGIATGIDNIYNSANWYERGYRLVDIALEGGKTAVGVITLASDEVPVLGQLGSATQDMIDAGIGTVQAGLKAAAVREKILASEKLESDMAFSVVVTDSDGNSAEEFYDFKMEYLGFKKEGEQA